MQLAPDATLRLSPSDLSGYLACPHLTTLELAVARGELERPRPDSPYRDLVFRKGKEHEAAYLAALEQAGRSVVRIPTYDDPAFDRDEARRLTEEAIRARAAEVIYQPYLADERGEWHGFADFLELQPGGGYEPVDTKLARSAKPSHVLQLLFYAEQVARLQAAPVERVHVHNGRGERETFRVAELDAYYRRVRRRFVEALAAPAETYPWPCAHCSICDFRRLCRERLVADDHLMLVAGMRRSDAEELMEAGVATLEELGGLAASPAVSGLRAETVDALRQQARLQLHARRDGRHRYELLADEEERGFRLLPAPDAGDVWFDIEGHPFYEPARGLEYLFGCCYREGERVVYRALWARDRQGERALLERF